MDENKMKDQNILLVKEKDSDKLKAVADIGKNGKLETVEAKAENASRFLTFDCNNTGELASIMSDFSKRANNLKDFQLFQVRYGKFEKQKEGLEEVLSRPHNSEGKELLKSYEVNPKDFPAKQVAEEPKVLLTQGEDGKLKAIAGEQDGKLKTVDPKKENADQFMKIDTNGNALENFFKKFSTQFNHPSHTGVYAVTASAVDKVAAFLDKLIRIDHTDKVLDPYRVKFDGNMKVQIQVELTGRFQPINLNKLDWKEVEKLGLSGEKLQDVLKAMVYGHKSPGLVEIKPVIDGQELPMQARLSLEKQDDGIKIVTHPKQEHPDFEKPFMSVVFTEQDKEQFQKTGHGGRVFDLEPVAGGEKVPSLLSLDKMTNRFEAVALKDIYIPQTLKNAPLSPEQQQGLKEGKAVWIEGMDKRVKQGEQPEKISRFVQFNASNKNFDFKFSDEQRQQHNEQRQARQDEGQEQKMPKARKLGEIWVYSKQGGVQLSREDFNKLCNKEPVFVKDMESQKPKQQADASGAQKVEATDQKGQKYNAWVWIDEDKGKVRHSSKHPDQVRAIEAKQAAQSGQNIKPAAESKTQVAVNNEGKTNEATKHSTEPLKKGQSQPTEKQAEKKEQKQEQKKSPDTPKKGKGRKM
ncbi:DUF4099 domain-containing protein [Macellibacteroides fermentans]|nr:DUF3945 domain-containing protein [Macellibacteroides fermentans]